MEINREDLLELLLALLLEEDSPECDCEGCQVESFDSVEDLIASLEGEDYEFCGCEEFDCDCEDCDCDECSCEVEEDELENIEESLSRVLSKKKTDEEILSAQIVEQEEHLAELYSKYKELTEAEMYELSKEYSQEYPEVDSETLETGLKMEALTDEIEDNLDSIISTLDGYNNNYVLVDQAAIRDLEDIRTLTFLADDIFKNLFERSKLED